MPLSALGSTRAPQMAGGQAGALDHKWPTNWPAAGRAPNRAPGPRGALGPSLVRALARAFARALARALCSKPGAWVENPAAAGRRPYFFENFARGTWVLPAARKLNC
jgi:hypothetical protein